MDNCCQVMADMKKVYDDLTIINLYILIKIKHFFISAPTPSFPSNNSVQYNRRRSATSHSTPNSPTKTRSRSEAFCTCMTTDPSLLGKKWCFLTFFGSFWKIQQKSGADLKHFAPACQQIPLC